MQNDKEAMQTLSRSWVKKKRNMTELADKKEEIKEFMEKKYTNIKIQSTLVKLLKSTQNFTNWEENYQNILKNTDKTSISFIPEDDISIVEQKRILSTIDSSIPVKPFILYKKLMNPFFQKNVNLNNLPAYIQELFSLYEQNWNKIQINYGEKNQPATDKEVEPEKFENEIEINEDQVKANPNDPLISDFNENFALNARKERVI